MDEEEKESVRGYPKELIEVIATMFMDPKGEDVQQ